MDPIHDDRCDEIDAILHAVQECSHEQLTGAPADVSNPIADTQELLGAVQRVQELIQAMAPVQDHANMLSSHIKLVCLVP